MVKRVSAWPILLFAGRVQEATANTFRQISLPMAQVGIASDGMVSGIEMCRIYSSLQAPDGEAGETNQVNAQITNASKTSFFGLNRDQTLWARQHQASSAGATANHTYDRTKNESLMCDGKGMLVWDKKLFAGIAGVGNSNTKLLQFKVYGYLVEATPIEVVGQMEAGF